jgi:hypothetical protein
MASRLQHLLWDCAGAEPAILSEDVCAPERRIYAAMGLAVLLTALLSTLSATIALATMVPPSLAVMAGLIWGLFTLALDRFVVSSVRREGRSLISTLAPAIPRIVLLTIFATVVAVPIELQIFRPELDHQRANRDLAVTAEIRRLEQDAARLHAEMSATHAQRLAAAEAALAEVGGRNSGHRPGAGPLYQARREQLELLTEQARSLRAANEAQIRDIDRRLGAIRDKPAEPRGRNILGDLRTLQELATDPVSGGAVTTMRVLILSLIILIEVIPLLLRLTRPHGVYDAALHVYETELFRQYTERMASPTSRSDQLPVLVCASQSVATYGDASTP